MNLVKLIYGNKLLRMSFLRNTINCSRNHKSLPNATSRDIKPSLSEKYYLVWTGKFKTIDDVPPLITKGALERAKGTMRIRLANGTMVVVLIICVIVAIMGKRKSEQGITIDKMVEERHQRLKEEARQKSQLTAEK